MTELDRFIEQHNPKTCPYCNDNSKVWVDRGFGILEQSEVWVEKLGQVFDKFGDWVQHNIEAGIPPYRLTKEELSFMYREIPR